MFLATLFIPIYIYIWQKSLTQPSLLFVTSACTGLAWTLHPVLGFTLSCLLGISILSQIQRYSKKFLFGMVCIFLLASAPFVVPALPLSYRFTNPLLASTTFIRQTVTYPYLGLGLLYTTLFVGSLVAVFLKPSKVKSSTKAILLTTALLLTLVWFGKQGYTPSVINQFQFSRSITILALLIPFAFASILQNLFKTTTHRVFWALLSFSAALMITNATEVASDFTAEPVQSVASPVTDYFQNKQARGAVYYHNNSLTAYFASEDLRLVGSYNDHLLPSPLSLRYKNLLKPNIGYTGVSQKHLELVDSYSRVLGVNYLFLPEKSSLVTALTQSNDEQEPLFVLDEIITTDAGIFAVLTRETVVANAYMVNREQREEFISFSTLTQPSLKADSFQIWDDQVIRLSNYIKGGQIRPINLNFPSKSSLSVQIPDDVAFTNQDILITQSFDPNWHSSNPAVSIQPTSLRFIYLDTAAASLGQTITLENTWPDWYWPVQSLGIFTLISTIYATATYSIITGLQKNTKLKNKLVRYLPRRVVPSYSTIKSINARITSLL